MTLALYGKSRRRQGGLLSLGLLAVLVAMLAGVATISSAFAHHPALRVERTCESITVHFDYVGPGERTYRIFEKTSSNDGSWEEIAEFQISGGSDANPVLDVFPAITKTLPSGYQYAATLNDETPDSGDPKVKFGDYEDCAKIIVKKVVTGTGADAAQNFTAAITNTDSSSGTLASLTFSQNAPYTHEWNEDNDRDDFEVVETVAAGYKVVAKYVDNGDDACPALGDNDWKTSNPETASGGDLDNLKNGDVVTVCFLNELPVGNIQVHKYLPKDPQPESGQAPWQNQGVGQGAWTFTVYPSLADAQAGTNALASFNQLGSNSPALPQTDLWIKETGMAVGHDFYGWFIPDGDTNSGNDKCNQAPLDFQSGNGYSTDPILFMPAAYWQTKGNQPGLFHICAYNKPGVVAATGKILVKKVGPTIPGGLASTIDFEGAVTGTNHAGTWKAKVGETDASNDGIADGQYTITETSGTGNVTGGKIELVGYEELSGDATCPTPDANNYNDDGVVTVDEDTHTICVLNKFIAIVDPTISKEKVQGGLTADWVYWDISVDNTASAVDQTVEIHDTGVTWNSTSGAGTGSCADTDFSDGKIVCTVKAGQTLKVQVKKARPAAQCTDQTINNSATLYLVAPEAEPELIGEDGGDEGTEYTIPGDPGTCDKPGITKEANSQTAEDSQTTQDPSDIWWTVTVTNPASGTGTAQTVWIKDSNVEVTSGPTFGGSATCAPNNDQADFETQLNDSDGVQCSMPNNSTITFVVKPAGTIARTCEDQKFNNTAYLYVGATTNTPLTASGEEITLWGDQDLCPRPKVTFVKLMCGPDATLPGNASLLFPAPATVTYDPNNLPADCFPMAGWNFYTGTTWNGSTLGGTLATHTTGADGTVTHEMTNTEFIAALYASGNPLTSYLVREEVRSPYTFGALQCYKDYGGAKGDNIEQVNFKDNLISYDVTCIAYNFVPEVTVNFIKAICPSLSDVPSNQAAGGGDADRGGLLDGSDPAAGVKVDLDNIPEDCDTVPGWQFNTGTEWNGSLGGSTASYTTTANGGPGGIAGVKHTLTGAEFMAALAGYETTGKSYFVQEVEQSPDYLFGAIKCYADHYLDDKIERVDFAKWGLPGAEEQIYCIAFNVEAEREITIEKHFYTDGYVAGEGDTPTFTLDDEDYPAVTFDSACEPALNGAPNHLAWTCTVPYDWDGTVTETPAKGWEEVTCEREFVSQLAGLVQSILAFEGQSYWEFCNAPYAEVKVQKTFVGDFSTYPAFTFTEDLSGAVSSAGPAANTTVSVYDQHVALGTYNVSEVQALTQQAGCFGDNAAGYFTHVSVTKNGSTIFAKQEASGASIPVTAPGDQVTVTIYNTRCELAASPIVIIEKFADPAGNRTGTNSISGFQIAVFVDAVQLDGDLVAPGVQPFTSNGGPIVIPGLDPATITAVEVNPNTGGWMFTGSKTDVGDDGSFEKSVAGQPAAEAITYDDVLRFNFYNQPRVNIEVNKTEISLATPSGAPGNGWSFTLTGCGITPQVKATDATGKATFTDLPPAVGCSYTVTETVKGGWSAINPVQVTAPATAGQTAVLNFTNIKIEVCTNCFTIVTPTPTPEKPTATPTATPTDPSDPTATPTEEPTKPSDEPKEDVVSGEKTPGPGQTPIAPSTGTGLLGSGPGGVNMLFALVGLLAISLGTSILALGRKSSRR